jgi:hypothetical protein
MKKIFMDLEKIVEANLRHSNADRPLIWEEREKRAEQTRAYINAASSAEAFDAILGTLSKDELKQLGELGDREIARSGGGSVTAEWQISSAGKFTVAFRQWPTELQGPIVPRWGEIVLRFIIPRKLRKAVQGDLEEDFRRDVERVGPRAARILYWGMVARSATWLLPLYAAVALIKKWIGQ